MEKHSLYDKPPDDKLPEMEIMMVIIKHCQLKKKKVNPTAKAPNKQRNSPKLTTSNKQR